MTQAPAYQRYERAANLIARHPFYPGKHEAVQECLEDIEEKCREGLLTDQQAARLIAIFEDGQRPGHSIDR